MVTVMKSRVNEQIVSIVIIVIIVVALLTIFYCNIRHCLEKRSVKLFNVLIGPSINMLDPGKVITSTAAIRQTILDDNIICDDGSLSELRKDNVIYIYLCKLDKIEINYEVEVHGKHGYKSTKNIAPIGIAFSESGNYTVTFFSEDYVKIYSNVFSFETVIPEPAKQGLIKAFEDQDDILSYSKYPIYLL